MLAKNKIHALDSLLNNSTLAKTNWFMMEMKVVPWLGVCFVSFLYLLLHAECHINVFRTRVWAEKLTVLLFKRIGELQFTSKETRWSQWFPINLCLCLQSVHPKEICQETSDKTFSILKMSYSCNNRVYTQIFLFEFSNYRFLKISFRKYSRYVCD